MPEMGHRFSIPAAGVFSRVQKEASLLDHALIEPAHLLLGIMSHKNSTAYHILVELEVDFSALEKLLKKEINLTKQNSKSPPSVSEATKNILEYSLGLISKERPYLGTEHLLLSLVHEPSPISIILQLMGISYSTVTEKLSKMPLEPLQEDQASPALTIPNSLDIQEKLSFQQILLRISPIFWVIFGATVASGLSAYWQWFRPDIAVFLFVTLGWIVSVSLHEFGHALVAYWGGDLSVLDHGYLTLNPLKYTHGFMSIVLPIIFLALGGFGLPGGAVYINLNAVPEKRMRSLLSAAGPLMTAGITLILAMPFWTVEYLENASQHSEFWGGICFLAFVQIWALVFNLLPIPGLDGFGIIMPFLPKRTAAYLHKFGSLGFFIFITLFLWESSVQNFFWQLVSSSMDILGVNSDLLLYGMDLYRFW